MPTAQSVTKTEIVETSCKKIIWEWTCTDAGVVTSATTAPFDGKAIGCTTIPGTGSDAPTAAYDVTITDAQGHDILLGAGADRSASATEHIVEANMSGVAGSILTLNIANAGDANKGTVILWIR